MAFPGDDMYGIDCVIPDVTYLVKNRTRLRGLFITHGHEDHIGAIPYVLKQINMPIYCTKFTAGLIKLKLQEHGLVSSTKLITVEPGQTVRAGGRGVCPPQEGAGQQLPLQPGPQPAGLAPGRTVP